jgi:hypothetical protein
MDTSLAVAIVALLAAVFGPTVTSWFAMRQAAQERASLQERFVMEWHAARRRERIAFLQGQLDKMSDARGHIAASHDFNTVELLSAWGKFKACALSLSDEIVEKIVSDIKYSTIGDGHYAESVKAVDQIIARLGEMIQEEMSK